MRWPTWPPGGARAHDDNTTAADPLLGAIDRLATQPAGIYDGPGVPVRSALPTEVEATRWA